MSNINIDLIDRAARSAAETNDSKTRKVGSDLDKNAFLKILCAQMSYQDPLSPMEDTQFISQLAQFTALEQSMESLENAQATRAQNLIGKEVLASAELDSSTGHNQQSSVLGTVKGTMLINDEYYVDIDDHLVPLSGIVAIYEAGTKTDTGTNQTA